MGNSLDNEATKVYERIDIDPVREFITRANEAILKIDHESPKTNNQDIEEVRTSLES